MVFNLFHFQTILIEIISEQACVSFVEKSNFRNSELILILKFDLLLFLLHSTSEHRTFQGQQVVWKS